MNVTQARRRAAHVCIDCEAVPLATRCRCAKCAQRQRDLDAKRYSVRRVTAGLALEAVP